MFRYQKPQKKHRKKYLHPARQDKLLKKRDEVIVQQASQIILLMNVVEQWKKLAEYEQSQYTSLLKAIEKWGV